MVLVSEANKNTPLSKTFKMVNIAFKYWNNLNILITKSMWNPIQVLDFRLKSFVKMYKIWELQNVWLLYCLNNNK